MRKKHSLSTLLFISFFLLFGCPGSDDKPVILLSDFFGTITDNVSGQPVAGVKVSAISGDLEGSDITDEEGKYKLSNLKIATYTLTVSKDGFIEASRTGIELNETSTQFDWALVPKGGLTGIVSNAQGEALENVEINLSRDGTILSSKSTDALGQYAFTKLESGSYSLNFQKEGFASITETVNVANGAPQEFNRVLTKLASISGKIIDKEEDVFLEGADISLRGELEQDVISTEFGDFEFANLPAGTYSLIIRAEGYETQMEEGIEIETGISVTRNFFMEPKSPVLKVDLEEVDFESELNNLPLTITNEGEGVMVWEIVENIDWLFVTPEAEETQPSETETVILQVDRSDLSPGEYSGQLTVKTARSGSETVSVKVTVSGQLRAEPSLIDYGSELSTEVISVKNAGQGLLDFTAQASHPWIRITPSSGTADANGQELEVSVDRDGVPAGNHTGSVFISSNAGAGNVLIKMIIPEPNKPQLTVSTEELDFGNVETIMPLQVTNTGQMELDWTFTENVPWMTVSPQEIRDLQPGEVFDLTVRVDRTGLTEGIHQGSIDFDSDDGGGARVDVFVSTFASAIIAVSTDELDFGAALDELTFRIENRGNEQLEWTIIPDQDWIDVSLPQGFDNHEIRVTVNRDLVTEGSSHSGNLRITSNGGEDRFVQVLMLTKTFPPDMRIGDPEIRADNGDFTANPGEDLSVHLPVFNANEAEVGNAEGVNVSISTDHPLLTSFVPFTTGLQSVRVGEVKYIELDLDIPEGFPIDEDITFQVLIVDAEDNRWEHEFSLPVRVFLSEGLREFFDFDDEIFKEVLSGDIGLSNGATPSTDTANGEGFSFAFDADNGHFLEIGRNLIKGFRQEATFSLWIKSDRTSEPMTLFHASVESNDRCLLEIVDENNIMVPNITFTKDVSPTLLDGEWHLLVVVLSEDISRLYLDDALVRETDILHTMAQFTGLSESWVFGRKGNEDAKYFDGLLDNIRLYDRVLSGTEVQLLFNSKK